MRLEGFEIKHIDVGKIDDRFADQCGVERIGNQLVDRDGELGDLERINRVGQSCQEVSLDRAA